MTEPEFSAAAFTDGSVASIGIRFSRYQAEARACWLNFPASPLSLAPQIRAATAEALPADLLHNWQQVESGETTAVQRNLVAAQLTDIALRLCDRTFSEVAETADEVLATGVCGAGVWNGDANLRAYTELIDSARLAEQFGVTVIDNLPGRDIAQGGQGGPMEAHGLCMLLADRTPVPGQRWRALVDISPHVSNVTVIGPPRQWGQPGTFMTGNVGVGSRLLSELKLTYKDAIGGRLLEELADSGEAIPELNQLWCATTGPITTWHPEGINALSLIYALQKSVYADARIEDLITTAYHHIAYQICRYVQYQVPKISPVGELFLMGEGSDGALGNQLKQQLIAVPVRRLAELGQDRTIHAAGVAVLTLFHLWQIPVPCTNSGETPRVPGRINPGSPSNWRRVLGTMTSNAPWLMPLREAI